MFRRSGKNPMEGSHSFYQEEETSVSTYKYNQPQGSASEHPPRSFESRATPLRETHEETSDWGHKEEQQLPHPFQSELNEESPETTLGEGVTFRGELSFERLLRIDGTFEGELLSEGKVVVGPKGKVKANLKLREAIIEGTVEGNIVVEEKLELRGDARVIGDVTAKSLCVDEGVILHGIVSVGSKESSF